MTGAPVPNPARRAAPHPTLIGAFVLLWGSSALACGSAALASAMRVPQVAGKFALASEGCADAPALPPPAAGAQAQQLSLYDRPAERRVTAPATPAAAPVAVAAPGPVDVRPVSPPPKGVGREAVSRALALVPDVNAVAEAYGIDPLLLHAIAHVESRHNPQAVSHAGALGLMQVMPATARRFGVGTPSTQLRDPRVSLEVSSAYLKTLQRRFDNNLTLVIAAYNAGEGAVEKYGRRVPPYKETQGYVRDVLAHYRLLVGTRDAIRPATRPAL